MAKTEVRPVAAPPIYARARWSVLASTGLFCVAAGAAILLLTVLAFGLDTGGETTLFGGVIALTVVAGLLVRRFGWWAKAVGIVAAIGSIMTIFWTAFSLGAVQS